MAQCLICGRESRGMVHDGHCHDVYYGRLTTQRRKYEQIDTADIKQMLATAATLVQAHRRVCNLYSQNQLSVDIEECQGE